jgi:hypothetical protein
MSPLSNLEMKTPYYTECLNFISDTNKGSANNEIDGEGVKDANDAMKGTKKGKKSKNSNQLRDI